MKKPLFLTCITLLSACGLFAQNAAEQWSVYDIPSKTETVTDLADMVPAAIVGRDDRVNITGKATDFEKAAVVLEMKGKNGRSLCSGAMVGPNIVLTAAHCLTQGKNYMESVQVFATGLPAKAKQPRGKKQKKQKVSNPQRNNKDFLLDLIKNSHKTGSSTKNLPQNYRLTDAVAQQAEISLAAAKESFPSAQGTKMWVPQGWRNATKGAVDLEKAEPYDYGIIVLDQPLGNKTGWLNVAAKSAKELKGKNIILLGRGGDKPSRTLWRAEGSVGKVNNLYLFHNADMVGGNSGGPVVLKNDPRTIVALNNFGPSQDRVAQRYIPNGCLRISTKIIDLVRQHSN